MTTQPPTIPVQWVGPGPSRLPAYQTPGASGLDLQAALEAPIVLEAGERRLVPTGIAVAIPPGMEAQVRPRSGLAFRHGLTTLNSPGTIDADYRGEIKVLLINHGQEAHTIEPFSRIAQLVFAPVIQIGWSPTSTLPPTQRGEGGFGSTGQ